MPRHPAPTHLALVLAAATLSLPAAAANTLTGWAQMPAATRRRSSPQGLIGPWSAPAVGPGRRHQPMRAAQGVGSGARAMTIPPCAGARR